VLQEAGKVGFPTPRASFEASGRLTARHGSEAFAASFRWRHDAQGDSIEFASPLGQTVALLEGNAEGVRLNFGDGRALTAADWVALTEQGLGWRLPVDGLAFWIQGAPRPATAFTVEAGEDGRAALLRQEGWTILYLAYAPDADATLRPSRLTLSYPEVELRVAVDSWR
jgi:outer membrane lipoprotein LolB